MSTSDILGLEHDHRPGTLCNPCADLFDAEEFTEITVISEGVELDSVTTWLGLDFVITRLANSYANFIGPGQSPIEVYALEHPHHVDVDECECAQYATSHLPVHVFNPEK